MAALTSRILPWGFHASTTNQPSNRARGVSICFPSYGVQRIDPHSRCWVSVPETKKCRLIDWHVSATNSEASVSDQKKKKMPWEDVEIVVISRDDDKITVRANLNGDKTQKAFDHILAELAKDGPPVPGFRRMKGGKTPNVPKILLIRMLGHDRVHKFAIEEIINKVISNYVNKEQLNVKDKYNTKETIEELRASFEPGKEFSFTATLDFESQSEPANADSSPSPGPIP